MDLLSTVVGSHELIVPVIAAAVLLMIVLLFWSRVGGNKRNTVLLTGLTGAGKTSLFFKLKDGIDVDTHSSMKENQETFVFHDERIAKKSASAAHVVDLPGHLRLRFQLDTYLPISAAIVHVVDSAVFANSTAITSATLSSAATTSSHLLLENAELLYDILANDAVQKNRTPVMIACHKSDLTESWPAEKIKKALQTEMNKIRKTRQATPTTQDNDTRNQVFLGYDNEDFAFEQLVNPVVVESTSTSNIAPVIRFVRKFYR